MTVLTSHFILREGNAPGTAVQSTTLDATHNVNFNCPTNPVLTDITDGKEYSIEIRSDNTATTGESNGISSNDGSTVAGIALTRYQNRLVPTTTSAATNTGLLKIPNTETAYPGYKIKESGTASVTTALLEARDVFIIFNPRDPNNSHIAKISRLEDEFIEFSPRFGEEIPKGTEYSIYVGPAPTDTQVVAVSYGIQFASASEVIVAPPHFYFYEDRLDKVNQLDHNKKYKLNLLYDDADTQTIVFVTHPDYNRKVIDYSKF